MKDMIETFKNYDYTKHNGEYPRPLLISESVIREFEDYVSIRFINKTKCFHDYILNNVEITKKTKANMYESIMESIEEVKNGEDIDRAFEWLKYIKENDFE